MDAALRFYRDGLGLEVSSHGSASGPHAGAKAVYMLDPDGYHVELYQRAQDSS